MHRRLKSKVIQSHLSPEILIRSEEITGRCEFSERSVTPSDRFDWARARGNEDNYYQRIFELVREAGDRDSRRSCITSHPARRYASI
jgi:hypothetical protein